MSTTISNQNNSTDLILFKPLVSYFEPSIAHTKYKIDASIPENGDLAIGYGAGGAAPLTYTLRPGQEADFGFLKLFLSIKAIDFSNIAQPSPFDTNDFKADREKKAEPQDVEGEWDTILVPIIQRKGKRC